MVIIGAGNLGKHIADQLIDEKYNEEIIFYDDHANPATPIFNRFKIINTENLLEDYFKNKNASFIAAAGHPRIRARLVAKAESLGGKSESIISIHAHFSNFSSAGTGTILQPGCCVSHNTKIGISAIIHANTLIGHDVVIGNYFSCGSNANILSPCKIGDFTVIGANALILPSVKIGNFAVIAAGAKVNRSVADYETYE